MFKMLRSVKQTCYKQFLRNISTTQFKKDLKLSDYIEINEENGVREICLNHHKTRNSLSTNMLDAVKFAITNNTNDKNLRAIVLSGKGSIWSTGHNLREIASDPKIAADSFKELSQIILDIKQCPVPVIAKVDGFATAAGLQLVASCDIVICTQSSRFSTPGVNVGVFCTTPGIAISRVMPRTKSLYMLMTGLPITAEEAYLAGLVSRVVPDNKIDDEIKIILNAIKKSSRAVIAFGKKSYFEQIQLPLKEAYDMGCETMSKNLQMPDCKEGISSFFEKRHPNWKHE